MSEQLTPRLPDRSGLAVLLPLFSMVPMQRIPVRHYGAMLFEIFEKLKTMEPSEERDKLVELTANQMHRDLVTWSHGSSDVAKVASDLARFTDGNIQLDLDTFVFEKIEAQPKNVNNNKKKK